MIKLPKGRESLNSKMSTVQTVDICIIQITNHEKNCKTVKIQSMNYSNAKILKAVLSTKMQIFMIKSSLKQHKNLGKKEFLKQ